MANTYAIYMRPRGTEKAVRHRDYEPMSDLRAAKILRSQLGPDAAIHSGTEHPLELPFGERLWLNGKKK